MLEPYLFQSEQLVHQFQHDRQGLQQNMIQSVRIRPNTIEHYEYLTKYLAEFTLQKFRQSAISNRFTHMRDNRINEIPFITQATKS